MQCQEPIARSEQLPYYAYVTAFLQTGLFLDSLKSTETSLENDM